jgi:hypothetical protein
VGRLRVASADVGMLLPEAAVPIGTDVGALVVAMLNCASSYVTQRQCQLPRIEHHRVGGERVTETAWPFNIMRLTRLPSHVADDACLLRCVLTKRAVMSCHFGACEPRIWQSFCRPALIGKVIW